MSLKPFILQSLFVLLFCTSFLYAVDPHHSPFRLDSYDGLEAYVGSIDYPTTQITREVLISEAKRVWDFLPKTGGPAMVSALYTANEKKIYFATSIKGPAAKKDLGFPPLLTNALDSCKKELANQGAHIFSGRCAELMVIAEWYYQNGGGHPDSHVQLPASGKLIVAVNHDRQVIEPCSENTPVPSKGVPFGCADVLPKLGFKADEIVETDPESCQIRRRSFGGLTVRGCVPKKPKPSPPGKPAPKKPTVQKPRPGKPKRPSNNKPKPVSPKMPAKPKTRGPRKLRARSNKGLKH
ncbi:hypothetical protein JOM56_014390 [Amanita muscaria]